MTSLTANKTTMKMKTARILLSFCLVCVVAAYDNNFLDDHINRVTTCRCLPYQFESNVGQMGGMVKDGKPEELIVSMRTNKAQLESSQPLGAPEGIS